MFVMALIVVLGIAYGVSGRNKEEANVIRTEQRILERENCYKLADLRLREPAKKIPASEKLIFGVLWNGGNKERKAHS